MTAERIDPATGKPLPVGVDYRGPKQYRARKRTTAGSRIVKVFPGAALARRWLSDKAAELTLGQFRDTRALERGTVRQLVDRYVTERMAIRENDRKGHIPAILADDIAALPLSKLTSAAVRGFRDRQAATMAAATVVKRLNLLAAICRHAITEWDVPLPTNPASATAVKRPEGADQKRDRRLQPGQSGKPSEEERLLAVMAESEHADDYWFVRFAIAQGTRRGEIAAMCWKDIDTARGTISLPRTKTMKHAKTRGPELRPLTDAARAVLADKINTQSCLPKADELIFDVGTMTGFSTRYGRLVKKAGLEDLTFHDLRHEATSRLARLYTNPLMLMRVTGHKDINSLNRYYQPLADEIVPDNPGARGLFARQPRFGSPGI